MRPSTIGFLGIFIALPLLVHSQACPASAWTAGYDLLWKCVTNFLQPDGQQLSSLECDEVSLSRSYANIWLKCVRMTKTIVCTEDMKNGIDDVRLRIFSFWENLSPIVDQIAKLPNGERVTAQCFDKMKYDVLRICLPIINTFNPQDDSLGEKLEKDIGFCVYQSLEQCPVKTRTLFTKTITNIIKLASYIRGPHEEDFKQCSESASFPMSNQCIPTLYEDLAKVSRYQPVLAVSSRGKCMPKCLDIVFNQCTRRQRRAVNKVLEILYDFEQSSVNNINVPKPGSVVDYEDKTSLAHCLQVIDQQSVGQCVHGLHPALVSIIRGRPPGKLYVSTSVEDLQHCIRKAFGKCSGNSRYVINHVIKGVYGLDLGNALEKSAIFAVPGCRTQKDASSGQVSFETQVMIDHCLQSVPFQRMNLCSNGLGMVLLNLVRGNPFPSFPLRVKRPDLAMCMFHSLDSCSDSEKYIINKSLYRLYGLDINVARNKSALVSVASMGADGKVRVVYKSPLEKLGSNDLLFNLPMSPPFGVSGPIFDNAVKCLEQLDVTTLDGCCPQITHSIISILEDRPLPSQLDVQPCRASCIEQRLRGCSDIEKMCVISLIEAALSIFARQGSYTDTTYEDIGQVNPLENWIPIPDGLRTDTTECLKRVHPEEMNHCYPGIYNIMIQLSNGIVPPARDTGLHPSAANCLSILFQRCSFRSVYAINDILREYTTLGISLQLTDRLSTQDSTRVLTTKNKRIIVNCLFKLNLEVCKQCGSFDFCEFLRLLEKDDTMRYKGDIGGKYDINCLRRVFSVCSYNARMLVVEVLKINYGQIVPIADADSNQETEIKNAISEDEAMLISYCLNTASDAIAQCDVGLYNLMKEFSKGRLKFHVDRILPSKPCYTKAFSKCSYPEKHLIMSLVRLATNSKIDILTIPTGGGTIDMTGVENWEKQKQAIHQCFSTLSAQRTEACVPYLYAIITKLILGLDLSVMNQMRPIVKEKSCVDIVFHDCSIEAVNAIVLGIYHRTGYYIDLLPYDDIRHTVTPEVRAIVGACLKKVTKTSLESCSPGLFSALEIILSGKWPLPANAIKRPKSPICLRSHFQTCDILSLMYIDELLTRSTQSCLNTFLIDVFDPAVGVTNTQGQIFSLSDFKTVSTCVNSINRAAIQMCVPGLLDFLSSIIIENVIGEFLIIGNMEPTCLSPIFASCGTQAIILITKLIDAFLKHPLPISVIGAPEGNTGLCGPELTEIQKCLYRMDNRISDSCLEWIQPVVYRILIAKENMVKPYSHGTNKSKLACLDSTFSHCNPSTKNYIVKKLSLSFGIDCSTSVIGSDDIYKMDRKFSGDKQDSNDTKLEKRAIDDDSFMYQMSIKYNQTSDENWFNINNIPNIASDTNYKISRKNFLTRNNGSSFSPINGESSYRDNIWQECILWQFEKSNYTCRGAAQTLTKLLKFPHLVGKMKKPKDIKTFLWCARRITEECPSEVNGFILDAIESWESFETEHTNDRITDNPLYSSSFRKRKLLSVPNHDDISWDLDEDDLDADKVVAIDPEDYLLRNTFRARKLLFISPSSEVDIGGKDTSVTVSKKLNLLEVPSSGREHDTGMITFCNETMINQLIDNIQYCLVKRLPKKKIVVDTLSKQILQQVSYCIQSQVFSFCSYNDDMKRDEKKSMRLIIHSMKNYMAQISRSFPEVHKANSKCMEKLLEADTAMCYPVYLPNPITTSGIEDSYKDIINCLLKQIRQCSETKADQYQKLLRGKRDDETTTRRPSSISIARYDAASWTISADLTVSTTSEAIVTPSSILSTETLVVTTMNQATTPRRKR